MNPEYIFIKTAAGEEALRLHRKALPRSLRTVLILVDGRTTAAELGIRLSNPAQTENALGDLERQGYIEKIGERSRDASSADPGAIASPPPPVVTEAVPVVTPDNSPDSVADEAETGGMEEAPIIVVRRGGWQRRTGPVFWALRLTGWGVGAILLIVLCITHVSTMLLRPWFFMIIQSSGTKDAIGMIGTNRPSAFEPRLLRPFVICLSYVANKELTWSLAIATQG